MRKNMWAYRGVPIEWGAEEVFVDGDVFCDWTSEALMKFQYDKPKAPEPPVKRERQGYLYNETEYDLRSPVYLEEHRLYLEKLAYWHQEQARKKDLSIYAPWGEVKVKIEEIPS